jgi:Tol biopolymer transport system component
MVRSQTVAESILKRLHRWGVGQSIAGMDIRWWRRALVTGVVAVPVLAAAVSPAQAYPRPGGTEIVPVAFDGTPGNGSSRDASMSADGRYIAFDSVATNLVPGFAGGGLLVRDRETGAIELVSVASDGTPAAGQNLRPTISANGRFVAFFSTAPNLVPENRLVNDVFVHDRETGLTERVSVASDGTPGNGNADSFTSISADGRYVAFSSSSSNLVAGDTNGVRDVFVHDRETRATERVSVGPFGAGPEMDGGSDMPALSADGRYVAFHSQASNLIGPLLGTQNDVFVHDRETGVTELVSVASDGTEGNSGSARPSISSDGRYVAFDSAASNLVPSDTPRYLDVFVRDREAGTTERVSVANDGSEGNENSWNPKISAEGRFVAFQSFASNLITDDTSSNLDVFVHDRETGTTEGVSVSSEGAQDAMSHGPSPISAGGRYVAFTSGASLVPGDTNGVSDVYLRDRGPSVGVGEVVAVPQGDRVAVSGWATFSGQLGASADDPAGDGSPESSRVGADLTGASLTYRPEQGDLLVRLQLASLPSFPSERLTTDSGFDGGAGVPAVLYGLRLEIAGTPYEVRVVREASGAACPGELPLCSIPPHFGLYRCAPECMEETRLSGGVGTTGTEIRVPVPLSALGAEEESILGAIEAFTALGTADAGPVNLLDEADLPDAAIPARRVSLGVAPAETPAEEVAFATTAAIDHGSFSGHVDIPSAGADDYRAWARACLGDVCGVASDLVVVQDPDASPSSTPTAPPTP